MEGTNVHRGLFRSSAREMKSTRNLVYCAMLLALQVALGMIASIPIGPSIRVSFGYLSVATVGALFGPMPAMINAALADILLSVLKPIGPYFPGFTITALVGGFIYGTIFYRREIKIRHVLLAKGLIDIFCNILLNTFWLQVMVWMGLMNGNSFFIMLPGRVLKNLIQYPVDVALLLPLILWTQKLRRRLGGE